MKKENFECTLRVIVFSRFDGRIVNPFDDAVVYEFRDDSDMPPLDLYLYNTTEHGYTGVHYDPVTVREVNKRSSHIQVSNSECGTAGVKRIKQKRLRKTTAFNPHDETPSFLKNRSKCNGQCGDDV